MVGEIEDVHEGPLDMPTSPAEYFPLRQIGDRGFILVVRTSQHPATLLSSIATTLHRIDSGIAVSDETTMDDAIHATQAALLHRFSSYLIGGFAPRPGSSGMVD